MHSKDDMTGAHTINQHRIFYYGCIKEIKSKVFGSTKHKHGNIKPDQYGIIISTIPDNTCSTANKTLYNKTFGAPTLRGHSTSI